MDLNKLHIIIKLPRTYDVVTQLKHHKNRFSLAMMTLVVKT